MAVATELHFGRAAERLRIAQPTLSELVQRLERDVGTPLLTRTTRRVALTGAGFELLGRAKVILDDVAAANAAVRRVASGEAGTVRLGITPPVVPVLAPHLAAALQSRAPDITLEVRRMWQPDLINAIAEGTVDVAITCGLLSEPPGVIGEVFCAETFMVALRTAPIASPRETASHLPIWPTTASVFRTNPFSPHGHRRNGRPSPTPPSHHRPSNLTRATSVPSDGLSNPPSTGF